MLRGAALAAALILASSVALGDTKFTCDRMAGGSPYFVNSTPGYDHDRYGTSPHDLVFQFGAFISSFDTRDDDTGDGLADFLAVPEWVAYEIKRYGSRPFKTPTPSPKRPNPWYEMVELGFLKSSQQGVTDRRVNRSYTGFGTGGGAEALGGKLVNRGHLAMKAHAQRIGWKQACNTHVFINAVPQQEELNQGEWLDLEAYSGAAANKFGRVWVVAGPVFDPNKSIQFIGHEGTIPVAVPHAMFKRLIKENSNSTVPDVLAFGGSILREHAWSLKSRPRNRGSSRRFARSWRRRTSARLDQQFPEGSESRFRDRHEEDQIGPSCTGRRC